MIPQAATLCLNTHNALYHLINRDVDYGVFFGGTSSAKTGGIVEALLWYCTTNAPMSSSPQHSQIFIVGATAKGASAGIMPFFRMHMAKYPVLRREIESITSRPDIIRFKNGWVITLHAVPNVEAAQSLGKCGVLYVNEAENFKLSVFSALGTRVLGGLTLVDFNPKKMFPVRSYLEAINTERDWQLRPDKCAVSWWRTTYRDNPFLSEKEIEKLERERHVMQFADVLLDGKDGATGDIVFTNARKVSEFPAECTNFVYGADYGFVDAMAFCRFGLHLGEWYVECLMYQSFLNESEYPKRALELFANRSKDIFCDNNPPSFVQSLQNKGLRAIATKKGAGSIRAGIDLLQGRPLNVVVNTSEASRNGWAEVENLSYATDRLTGQPDPDAFPDKDNHFLDCMRYAALGAFAAPAPTPYTPRAAAVHRLTSR